MIPSGPDVALRAVGLALAGASMTFAVNMFWYGDGRVRVVGMEHLAIFAQPRGSATTGGRPAAPLIADPVDISAIGSLGEPQPAAAEPKKPEIFAARPDRVWLRVGGRIVAAGPGEEVEGLGKIGAIVRRDKAWTVLDDKGAVLIALPASANGVALFSKTRIFE